MNSEATRPDEKAIADRFFRTIEEAVRDKNGPNRDSLTRFCNRHGLYAYRYTSMKNGAGADKDKYRYIDPVAILYAYRDYGANPTYIVTGEGDMFLSGKEADDAH